MKKKEGFDGQKMIVLPESIQETLKNNKITQSVYVSDIGYYPRAEGHYRERDNIVMQNILIYNVGGYGWFEVNGIRKIVKPNQFFVIPENTPHKYGAKEGDAWSIYWMHFSGTEANKYFSANLEVGDVIPDANARLDERIKMFDSVYRNFEHGYSNENLEYANICALHFLASFRYIDQYKAVSEIESKDLVTRVSNYVREHMTETISLDELASHCGLSVSHFCLSFKKKSKQTPVEFITHMRIQKACQLLDFTDQKINSIAAQVGFQDPLYFSKVFSKAMGQSPKKYRSLKKG